jgi:NADPH:quinone reductase-like Zn-dependent oxidoreductase
VLAWVLALAAAALGSGAIALSHDSGCPSAPPAPSGPETMRAVRYHCYGEPSVLGLETVPKPAVGDSDVLIRVRAASLNPLDWHFTRGTPYLMRLDAGFGRPEDPRVGVDFAGTVEAVGESVTRFKPGDEVFGRRSGALAEYLGVRVCGARTPKPANITFEQAAGVPVAAVTALQALRDKGHLAPGQKVLINGASGGVGTFTVQIAKALGAEVTAVTSGRNAELVRILGADRVIDYAKEDFARGAARYDLIVDNVGNRSLADLRRVLVPAGAAVLVGGGGPKDGRWIGPLIMPIKALLLRPFVRQKLTFFIAEMNRADLASLAELMADGKVTPVVDRIYPLEQAAAALRYLEEGHARGKVIVSIAPRAE